MNHVGFWKNCARARRQACVKRAWRPVPADLSPGQSGATPDLDAEVTLRSTFDPPVTARSSKRPIARAAMTAVTPPTPNGCAKGIPAVYQELARRAVWVGSRSLTQSISGAEGHHPELPRFPGLYRYRYSDL